MIITNKKENLIGFSCQALENFCQELGFQAFHGRNLFKWIHKQGETDFSLMTNLSKILRAKLAEIAEIRYPTIVFEQPSTDGTHKWLIELDQGNRIESVFIPEGNRGTLCVSSQVGCSFACTFCSTAQQGFNRNLTTAEIIGQLWVAQHVLSKKVTNVVMMGMGEPLANFNAVVDAMHIMQHDSAYMLSKYRVTLSTSGIVPAIFRLKEVSNVSLAVSLHAATNELRSQLMPINDKYPLEQLIPACRSYFEGQKRRKITWEYVMLDGINDRIKDAKALIQLLEGTPSKVNLIPFNPFPNNEFKCSPMDKIEQFSQRLKKAGLVSTIRQTRGDDIDAACGQLVGKVQDKSRRQLRLQSKLG